MAPLNRRGRSGTAPRQEASGEPVDGSSSVPRAKVKTANKMLRDFFLGFIKIHVLHHASKGPFYGVWFLAELARHGYELSPGTLYPLLHGLEADGYLEREDRVVEGKVRKYYRITPLGGRALKEARTKIGELIDELNEDGVSATGRPASGTQVAGRRR
jgi:PadR family transcriptional regulator PadR